MDGEGVEERKDEAKGNQREKVKEKNNKLLHKKMMKTKKINKIMRS